MSFQCGIVGLPNVGKSTLFNALSNAEIDAANYPFCTIEPNVGLIEVPDLRLIAIKNIVQPANIIPTSVKFVDIAGLVAGASKGEGLGNKFLAHIRETQAIIHVVRCHNDSNIIHVDGKVDPINDVNTIDTELSLADLETVDKAINKQQKLAKTGDKAIKKQLELLMEIQAALTQAPLRRSKLSDASKRLAQTLNLITIKPVLYVANASESPDETEIANINKLTELANTEQAEVVVVCAKIEAEISLLSPEDKVLFLEDLGITESGLDKIIKAGYKLLNLITFFTAGPKELRAWTVVKGAYADQAAGVIHTDFQTGFIRAEVISYEDFITNNGEKGAKEAGVWRLEGKDYMVNDGDVMFFRFNV